MDFQSQTKNNVERELRFDIASAKAVDKGILHSKMLYYQCLPEKTKSCQQCAQPESTSVWWRSSKRRQTLEEVNSATRDDEISGRVIQGQKGSFRSLWSELLHHSQQEDSQCFMHKLYGVPSSSIFYEGTATVLGWRIQYLLLQVTPTGSFRLEIVCLYL